MKERPDWRELERGSLWRETAGRERKRVGEEQ
jgi:hypothetical protein